MPAQRCQQGLGLALRQPCPEEGRDVTRGDGQRATIPAPTGEARGGLATARAVRWQAMARGEAARCYCCFRVSHADPRAPSCSATAAAITAGTLGSSGPCARGPKKGQLPSC